MSHRLKIIIGKGIQNLMKVSSFSLMKRQQFNFAKKGTKIIKEEEDKIE
jgi:hypothetical protein